MILAHPIIGIALWNSISEFWWFIFIGSIIPDIDHLVIIFQHKIFSFGKIVDTLRFEKKYNISYKTKYIHSVLGAIIISILVSFINPQGSFYFFFAYIVHLALDWFDIDEKQYFYPLKTKVHGFLPIFSKLEIIFTLLLFVVMLISVNF